MLAFQFFQDLDNSLHAGNLVSALRQAHLAASHLARVNQLALFKLGLGAFNQFRNRDAAHSRTGYIFPVLARTTWNCYAYYGSR